MRLRNRGLLACSLLAWGSTILGAELAAGSPPADLQSRADSYLEAVCDFAETALEYGRDVYGPKHAAVFVDVAVSAVTTLVNLQADGYSYVPIK